MITIIADSYRSIQPPPDAQVAQSVTAYVPLRQRIREALNEQTNLTVYVCDPVVLQWLDDLQQYPSRAVTWRTVDPLEDFTRQFGVSPSAPFTPDLIVALRLASLPARPPTAAADPLSHILGVRLGALWQSPDVQTGHVSELIAWAMGHAAAVDPLLLPLMKRRLAEWAESDSVYSTLDAERLHANAAALLVRWALRRYDPAWRQAQAWGKLPLVDVSMQPAASISALEGQHHAITAYWSQRYTASSQSADVIDLALQHMSGLSQAELTVLVDMIERHPERLDERLNDRICQQFADLPQAQTKLQELTSQIAPTLPVIPDNAWTTDQWLQWATSQYMPYFTWIIRAQRPRTQQQEYATRFADWLAAQYPTWLNDEHGPILLSQYRHMRDLLGSDADAVVVWLVIDGLTWWQGEIFRDICEAHGLVMQGRVRGVAVLPSITKVSKRALVTGLPTIDIQQTTIAQAAREQLQRSGIIGHVSYSVNEAQHALQQNPRTRCLIVLCNMIDVLAHQTTAFTDGGAIRGELDDLARALANMQRIATEQGRAFHALIGSDHGSTLLPADAKGLALPQTSQEVSDDWESETANRASPKPSTRAAVVADPMRMLLDTQMPWYFLERNRYQLDQHYLVPRGYNYVQRRPSGWTHGGLTPEEVLVPLLHFAPHQLAILDLSVQMIGALRPLQNTFVAVTVGNPNRFPIEELTFTISEGSETHTIGRINPLSQHEMNVEFAGVIGQMVEVGIRWQIRYQVAGVTQHQEGQTTLHVRRLQTDDTGFDDMFEDL